MIVRVQAEDFDPHSLLDGFGGTDGAVGAVCSFTGLVRASDGLSAMTLEYYPGMAEKQLEAIAAEAMGRWPLADVLIIHRFGRLRVGARIVLVATASAHRDAAFDACRFLMDWLKTKAPFWKQEHRASGDAWVAAKAGDDEAAAGWNGA